jgi:hypothetical protein
METRAESGDITNTYHLFRGVSDENRISNADFRSSASVGWEYDWTRSIGDRRGGGMVCGKSSDAHDNVEAELKT